MLALVSAGALTAYTVALHSATRAYDRALWDTAISIAQQIQLNPKGQPVLDLTHDAEQIIRTDKFDQILFGVYTRDGQWVSGELRLPIPNEADLRKSAREGRLYYDGEYAQQALRLAAFATERGGFNLIVVVGETKIKRQLLVREILLGMLLPEIALILITLLLIWFGIRSGLQPLETLREELAARSPSDLSPVKAAVPSEMSPVIHAINELLERLANALSAQRHLVSVAAHQLRTPIAALQAQLEMAVRQLNPVDCNRFDGSISATKRLSHLVNQLLFLARAEPAQHRHTEALNLENVIRDAAEICLPKAIAKDIDLGFELQPTQIKGEYFLLREAVTNLLDNALHHTPNSGTVTVACGSDLSAAWLSVDDSGPGIASEERERVFERFYQAPGQNEGCGLGLAIVEAIVKQHGGKVTAQASERLGGALFKIQFAVGFDGVLCAQRHNESA